MQRHHAQNITLATVLALAGAASVMAANEAPAGKNALPARIESQFSGLGLVTPAGMSLYVFAAEDSTSDRFRWQCANVPPAAAPPATQIASNAGAGGGAPAVAAAPNAAAAVRTAQAGAAGQPAAAAAAGLGGQAGAAFGRGGGGARILGIEHVPACTAKYKPYVADANAKPVGDFTIVQRPEGVNQWAFKGFPLYTNTKDTLPGQRNATNGGGAQQQGAGGRFAAAQIGPNLGPPPNLVTGVRLARIENDMVLNIATNNRPLYTPSGKRRPVMQNAALGDNEAFQPFLAPVIANVSGDWSIVDAGVGRKQYAYKGKPLYLAPPSMSDYEISLNGGWETVATRKMTPPPAQIDRHMTLVGEVYATSAGLTLYSYSCNAGATSCDESGDPAVYMGVLCGDSKECARRWHPYLAPANAKGQGEWSVIDITYPMFLDQKGKLYPAEAPKVKAWAYRGSPVFTYHQDEVPGDIWGNKTVVLGHGASFNAIVIPGLNGVL